MAQLLGFKRTEHAQLDVTVLLDLEVRHGPDCSRRILSDAALDIIERLTRFEVAIAGPPGPEPSRLANSIAVLSERIGASELVRAARAAGDCHQDNDAVSRAATAQRLIRAGEAALAALLATTMAIDN